MAAPSRASSAVGQRDGYNEIHEFCRDLTLCSRGHSLFHDNQWFHVYCFKEASGSGPLGRMEGSRDGGAAKVLHDDHHRANDFVVEVHDRMPVLLTEDQFSPWLSGEVGVELWKPARNDFLQRWPVSKRVNSSKADADDSTLVEAIQPGGN
jgi:hypothetical protein